MQYFLTCFNISGDTVVLIRDVRNTSFVIEKTIDTFSLSPLNTLIDTIRYSLPGVDLVCDLKKWKNADKCIIEILKYHGPGGNESEDNVILRFE